MLANFKSVPNWVWLAGAAGVAFLVIKKGSVAGAVAAVTETVTSSAVGAIEGAAVGTITGIGAVVGVPSTSRSMCEAAIMAADNLKASKYCTAGQFATWQYLSARKKLTGKTFTLSDIFN